MSLYEVSISPGGLEVVSNFNGLHHAVGQLALADQGYVVDREGVEATIPDTVTDPDFPMSRVSTVAALKFLLLRQYPDLAWMQYGPEYQHRHPSMDGGFHHDFDYDRFRRRPFGPKDLVVGYHESDPKPGETQPPDVEMTLGSPTEAFYSIFDSQNLGNLLDRGLTDSMLIKPASIRSARLRAGGAYVFTHKRPGARAQAHRFKSHSTGAGQSLAWAFVGRAS